MRAPACAAWSRVARALCAGVLAVCVAPWALCAGAVQQREVKDLAREIASERDGADPKLFEELASHGTEEALAALEDALGRLRKPETRAAALLALQHFRASPPLRERALGLLVAAAVGEEGPPASAAANALVAFGEDAVAALERALVEAEDPVARAIACDALVARLKRRGDAEAFALVLANATLDRDGELGYLGISPQDAARYAGWTHREVVRDAIASNDSPQRRALLIAKLDAGETSRAWKLLLIEVLSTLEGPEVDAALARALQERDASLVLEAIARVRARGGTWEEIEPKLRPLMSHADAAVRRAATLQMGFFGIGEPAWRAEVVELASSKDAALRMGAASALAELRTPEAMAALHGLVADRDWSVRVEALEAVVHLRRKESIPVLIERLRKETGRFQTDVHTALRFLTGLDHGRLPERWEQWWAADGAAFELPTYESARAKEDEREAKAAEATTRSSTKYFGMQVETERVVFVLDVSGSMRLPSGGAPAEGGDVELTQPTRMDVAKRELLAVLRALPDETLFNVVFFETEVSSLEEKLVRMRKPVRQKALRFVTEKYAIGSTALYPALKLAFADPVVDTIYLLSDGAPTDGEITDIAEIRAEVRRWNSARHVRIHGIAMGQDSTLLHWLTEDTGGRYLRVD